MNKHTPGPWTVNSMTRIEGPAFGLIASVRGSLDDEQTHANARLIAAAPDLSALLAEAVSRVDDLVDALGKSIIEVEDLAAWSDDARALIARIEGNPQ